MNAIEISGLTKRYGAQRAVNRLSLCAEAGTVLALLGMNGAGKTTVIRMLCGLTPPDAGTASICGHPIGSVDARAAIGLSPQETAIAPNLTADENLMLLAGIHGMTRAEARRMTDSLTEALSLHEVGGKRAKALSGGWQRRLSIAMALVAKPKVLFLDEPTLGLDVVARRELWAVIRKLKDTTLLLTTHYLEEAEALADRIAILKQGELRAVGTAKELTAQAGCESFEDAFVALAEEGK